MPVYGLGSYADGRPFYAMRFIRGDSLKDAIERFHKSQPRIARIADKNAISPIRAIRGSILSLEFRKLLGRFVDVCNAIAYAHSRGVLHRDLKPGNIMLGKYGETLVVDWGLAKAAAASRSAAPGDRASRPLQPRVRPATAPTPVAGTAIGTPAYMSPEQAAGRLDQLGPASDVYSLGATLYCLLTGRAPIRQADAGRDAAASAARRVPAGRARSSRRSTRAAGSDLPEGDGAGAGGPLRHGARPGRGRRALAGGRAGERLAGAVDGEGAAMGGAASGAGARARRRRWWWQPSHWWPATCCCHAPTRTWRMRM